MLERAGLITRGRDAQRRPCRLETSPLREVTEWAEHFRRFWDASYARLDGYLEQMQENVDGPARASLAEALRRGGRRRRGSLAGQLVDLRGAAASESSMAWRSA